MLLKVGNKLLYFTPFHTQFKYLKSYIRIPKSFEWNSDDILSAFKYQLFLSAKADDSRIQAEL